MKIKAKHLLIGGGILASIIALTSMSGSASSTNSSSSGSGSGNNQRTGEENGGLTNSSIEDKINSDVNLQIKLEIAKLKTQIEIMEKEWQHNEGYADLYHDRKIWDKYNYYDGERRRIRNEIIAKEGELKYYESLLV